MGISKKTELSVRSDTSVGVVLRIVILPLLNFDISPPLRPLSNTPINPPSGFPLEIYARPRHGPERVSGTIAHRCIHFRHSVDEIPLALGPVYQTPTLK